MPPTLQKKQTESAIIIQIKKTVYSLLRQKCRQKSHYVKAAKITPLLPTMIYNRNHGIEPTEKTAPMPNRKPA
jgi:hypothetical protein